MSKLPSLLISIFAVSLFAEAPDRTFDVASIKATSGVLSDGRVIVGMLPPTGGPGTNSPARIRYPAVSLKMLLLKAFAVQDTELQGPRWLDDQFFEVLATMPSDTTDEQFRGMLRTLLSERFKLAVRREPKATSGYRLLVAKNGPKMRESESRMPLADQKWVPRTGKDGFVVPRRGQRFFVENGPERCRWSYQHSSMKAVAAGLATLLGSPVEDATGLTKEYDLNLTFRTAGTSLANGPGFGSGPWSASGATAPPAAPDSIDAVPDIFGAVQLLGLKLERNSASKEMLVIDHVERLPTAN
ncbi:MAG: hypothetical protein JWN34_1107 [Bryobacterales bacterium]|nr:hypothetical protein [Bryobacterales bacterium]